MLKLHKSKENTFSSSHLNEIIVLCFIFWLRQLQIQIMQSNTAVCITSRASGCVLFNFLQFSSECERKQK